MFSGRIWKVPEGGWRRGRDSNPRYGCPYTRVSRRAPSTTRPPLHRTPGRTHSQFFKRSPKASCAPSTTRPPLRRTPARTHSQFFKRSPKASCAPSTTRPPLHRTPGRMQFRSAPSRNRRCASGPRGRPARPKRRRGGRQPPSPSGSRAGAVYRRPPGGASRSGRARTARRHAPAAESACARRRLRLPPLPETAHNPCSGSSPAPLAFF